VFDLETLQRYVLYTRPSDRLCYPNPGLPYFKSKTSVTFKASYIFHAGLLGPTSFNRHCEHFVILRADQYERVRRMIIRSLTSFHFSPGCSTSRNLDCSSLVLKSSPNSLVLRSHFQVETGRISHDGQFLSRSVPLLIFTMKHILEDKTCYSKIVEIATVAVS